MKRLHQIVGLVLLVLWVPVTSHCMLEDVRGLEFLKCAPVTPEGDNHCDADACSQLESPSYRISQADVDVAPPIFAVVSVILTAERPVDEGAIALIKNPPEFLSTWQFSFRTALPPRAPSFVS